MNGGLVFFYNISRPKREPAVMRQLKRQDNKKWHKTIYTYYYHNLKMKNIILISIAILSWNQLFSQNYPTKKELKRLFSEKQQYLGELEWETCNDDSAYYKNDTIRLYYRNTTCLNQGKCCEKIDWVFFNSISFGLSNTSLCQEPPISSAIGTDDIYKIKIKKFDKILELHITNSKNQIFTFEVVSLIKCEGEYMASGKYGFELSLKRNNKK